MRRRTPNTEAGFSLIEVLMSIVILGVVGIGLVQSLAVASLRTRSSGDLAFRAATLSSEVSRISAIPDGMLPDTTMTTTVTTEPFPHTVSTTAVTSGTVQTVTIIVTPTGPRALGAMSRTLVRRAGSSPSPFL